PQRRVGKPANSPTNFAKTHQTKAGKPRNRPSQRQKNWHCLLPRRPWPYRNGKLIGGLGISGDGVDQDDFVTNGGTLGFEAPLAIRADQVIDRNVRLPYMKFPRNPTF